MKKIQFKPSDLPNLIVKAELEGDEIKKIKFGLAQKSTKLEKLLLKYVEIYCYDVFRNNFHNLVLEHNKGTK